jgi:geranylgeranyl pyrophosphate synthase
MTLAETVEEILKQKAQLVEQSIEKYVPRQFREDSLLFRVSPPKYKMDVAALNKTVAEPFWEFLDRGGKRWRPALFLLTIEALGGNADEFLDFAAIPEIIHNGTLIADDVEDSSKLRRGKPCTYELFGLDVAVNLSNVMYFIPMLALIENTSKVSSEKARRLYEIYIEEMVNISFGQAIDIGWHNGVTPAYKVTEEQYLQMCAYKTGTLARMAARMAAVLANADENAVKKVGRFAESVGVAFQIQDDILDLVGEEFAKGKGGLGMDVTEGKLTLIMIHTLGKASSSDREELVQILGMHSSGKKARMKAISIVRKYGSIEYAKSRAANLVRESWAEVSRILPPSDAKKALEMLAKYLIEREI